ncbi:MAG: hypothetical protein JW749_08045 [Sedimentisphaerales bacterium]|nr:hypothetical protein [Sedimentisphaerales bacterium]
MKRIFLITIFLFIAPMAGCNKNSNKYQQKDSREKEQTLVGYLSKEIMQHPIIEPGREQDYFDIYKEGQSKRQIIVIYNEGVEHPKDRGKLIELVGKSQSVNLGGEPQTKDSYQGTVIYVRKWRYLSSKETSK